MSLHSLFVSENLILLEAVFIAGIALFLLVYKNFTYGIYAWLLSNLFFGYNMLHFKHTILPDISFDRVLFVFLVILFFIEVLTKKRKLFSPKGLELSMFLLCLLIVISMLWSNFIIKEGGRIRIGPLLTGYVFPFVMFFISQHVYDTTRKKEGFIKFIILIGFYLSFTAIFEHFRIDSLIWPKYIIDPRVGIHFGRARGPFCMAAVNGTILGIIFLSSFYFLIDSKKTFIWRYLSLALLVLTPIGLFFTYTRGPWLGTFLGFAILSAFILKYRKKIFIILFIFLFLVISWISFFVMDEYGEFSLVTQRVTEKEPVYDRLNLYVTYIKMFMDHPILGIGFGKFQDLKTLYYEKKFRSNLVVDIPDIHDTFLGTLAEMGIVGFMLILYIYISIFLKARRLYKRIWLSRDNRGAISFVLIFLAVMTAYLVSLIFTEMRYFQFANSLFFIFAGIIYGWERTYSKEREIARNETSYGRAISG